MLFRSLKISNFCPQHRHVAVIRVKFGVGTPNFTPIAARVGVGPKFKIVPKFWNINSPQGHIPQAIFTKFSPFVGSISLGGFAQGILELWGFKFRECILSLWQVWWGSDYAPYLGMRQFVVYFLYFCLSVMLLNDWDCKRHFAIVGILKQSWYCCGSWGCK